MDTNKRILYNKATDEIEYIDESSAQDFETMVKGVFGAVFEDYLVLHTMEEVALAKVLYGKAKTR
jgi:hypothetical protein